MSTLPCALHDGLVFRSHQAGECLSRVWYSPCSAYRYGLSRVWDDTLPSVLFVMLNPSTADEFRNDPTVARCETRARRMGFGAVMIANLFAFRATKPEDLKQAKDPCGPQNDAVLEAWAQAAGMIIAAWGVHGDHLNRCQAVAKTLPDQAFHLGLTKHGHPRHPLYVALAKYPDLWPRKDRYPGSASE